VYALTGCAVPSREYCSAQLYNLSVSPMQITSSPHLIATGSPPTVLLPFTSPPSLSFVHSLQLLYTTCRFRMYFQTSITLGLLAVCQLVAGHGAIVAATGDQGGAGMAIGSTYIVIDIATRCTCSRESQLTRAPHVMAPEGIHSNRTRLASEAMRRQPVARLLVYVTLQS